MLAFICVLLTNLLPISAESTTDTSVIETAPVYETYRGMPVLDVTFDTLDKEDHDALFSLVDIHPGYLLSEDLVQQALQRLYALDRYADISVYINQVGKSVELHFVLTPILHMGTITLHVEGKADITLFKERLKKMEGTAVEPDVKTTMHNLTIQALHDAGYPNADIRVEIQTIGPRINTQIHVKAGLPRKIEAIHLQGNIPVEDKILTEVLHARVGDVTNRNILEEDRMRLIKTLKDHDFRAARVENARVAVGVHGDIIYFEVDAGTRTHIELQGNTLFSKNQIFSLWPNDNPSLTDGDFDLFERRIKEAYALVGYPRVEITRVVSTKQHALSKSIAVQIKEGPHIAIERLSFDGASGISAKILRDNVQGMLRDAATDRITPRITQLIDIDSKVDANKDGPFFHARITRPEELWIEEVLEEAPQTMHRLYQNQGFLNAHIDPPTYTFDGHTVTVRYHIVEGPRFLTHGIIFHGNTNVPSHELLKLITEDRPWPSGYHLALGEPIHYDAIEDARVAIVAEYRNRGYIYARCTAEFEADKDHRKVRIVFNIEEGNTVHIQRVLIRGNTHTYTGLIRSRIKINSGDLYTIQRALDDQRAISQLEVFSSVRVRLLNEDQPSELKDLVVDVREKQRHRLALSAGMSVTQGPRVRFSYQHANLFKTAVSFLGSLRLNRQIFFPLYGKYGDLMRSRYDGYDGIKQLTHALEREIRLGLRSPPLRMLPLDPLFRIDLVNGRENAVPYSLDTLAAILGVDLHPHRTITFTIEPQLSISNLTCADAPGLDCENQANSSPTAGQKSTNRGLRRMFKLGSVLTLDLRDNPLVPKKGLYVQLFTSFARGETRNDPAISIQELFSNNFDNPFSFTRIDGRITGYVPVGVATLALSARGGTIIDHKSQCAPADERFYLGGRDTVRGFLERTLFANDATYATSDQSSCVNIIQQVFSPGVTTPVSRGGHHYVLLKGELRVPIYKQMALGLFLDAGNLWVGTPEAKSLLDLRLGTGAGLRYQTPVGVISVDIGVNPRPRTYLLADGSQAFKEQIWQLHFSVGAL